jgi:predicted GIY-YIG superfamily endonuclease
MGTIEYVGKTCNPRQRWNAHKCNSNDGFNGKFYGRSDISMHIVKSFDNKKDALNYEEKLQKECGFTPDREKRKENPMFKKGKILTQEHKLKISATKTGKSRSAETKLKISEGTKLYWLNKKNNS